MVKANGSKEKTNYLVIAFLFIIMILSAMGDNLRGVFIPSFKSDFLVQDTHMGIMLVAGSIGYIIFAYLGGMICETLGHKRLISIGVALMVISLFTLYLSPNFVVLMIGMFLINAGWAFIGVSINTVIPIIAVSFQAIIMNLVHFCFGVGATITQRTAGLLLSKGVEWRTMYLCISILFFIVLLAFIPVKIPFIEKSKEDKKIDYKSIFKNKLVYFYMISLGFYVGAEIGTGNWFVNYMKETYAYSENQGTYYTTLFFGTFALGRLLGGFIAEKLGTVKTVLISSVLAFLFYFSGLVIGQNGLALVGVSGLFFSVVFPTLILSTNEVFKKNTTYIIGIFTTASSAISMVINFVIGWLNDLVGVPMAYYTIPVCLFFNMIFVYLIYKNSKTQKYNIESA
ncbi:major facilitator superfamily protein [Proteiniborus sp. DW1]|uniref:MFS transporter n=1 Tax=Proteiniborus sp. DW1 TaxID=1889883 RepID=UPI00092E0100|nr:MFS transporter [Proteiniborus sp. DW1]SCG81626.1 major facilitator superfamily protein [Proteiniborus sp. DW1]